ncbi:MAG: sigma 54-interacting transcriptional regulator [Desulfobacterales bacterium]|nr:sigma 54-interacting transcriptional regulator [Desulfobacterales bacterium]
MKGSILVIDDEENIRLILKTILEKEGYEVYIAEDHASGLTVLSSIYIDVIICDIIMPNMTGIEFLEEVKSKKFRQPVIMITGYPDINTASAALRLGAFDYISKPIFRETLLHVVNLAIRHKMIDDENQLSKRYLEAIFKNVHEGIVSVNPHMIITRANKAIEKLFNRPIDELIGKNIQKILDPAFISFIEVLEKTIQNKLSIREYRTELSLQNYKEKVVAIINSSPLIDNDGSFLGAVLVVRDISRLSHLENKLLERQSFYKIIGKNKKMEEIYSLIESLAPTDTTVLITGKSGTGKERIAEAIHYTGHRVLAPFVKVNCNALSESLLESELFGHVAGSFTGASKDKIGRFQMAEGGTIFLDEIGDISKSLQLKLLRVLQEKEFERVGEGKPIKLDVRVIAATNSNLKEKIREGKIREDIYYRLNVVEIHLPDLKDRFEDIPLLVTHFCNKFNNKFHKNIIGVSEQVMQLFLDYSWPGNIRELEHIIERAYIFCKSDTITIDHLPSQFKNTALQYDQPSDKLIIDALTKAKWNRTKAAKILNISRQTLYRKIKEFNISSTSDL